MSEPASDPVSVHTAPIQMIACKTCGREFDSQQALSGHMLAHQEKQPCPDCGEMFVPGAGMGRHRAAAHPEPKRRGRPPGVPNKAKAPKAPDLNIDEIFEPVIAILWPGGSVPSRAIAPLLRWREATVTMLEEIK